MSTTERVRFTIAVDADVYEAFAELAHSSGVSMSRCIGDWLRDTAESAQMTTIRVNEVRKSHQEVHRLYLESTARQVEKMLSGEVGKQWRIEPDGSRVEVPFGSSFARSPRPVIRGGKSPEQGKKVAGKRSS